MSAEAPSNPGPASLTPADGAPMGQVLSNTLTALDAQQQDVLHQVAITSLALQQAQAQHAVLDQELAALQVRDRQLRERVANDAATMAQDRSALDAIARSRYVTEGQTGWWPLLLGSGSFADLLGRLDAASRIDTRVKQLLGNYTHDRADAETALALDRQVEAQVTIVQGEIASIEAQLATQLAQEQSLLARVNADRNLASQLQQAAITDSSLINSVFSSPDPVVANLLAQDRRGLDSVATALSQLAVASPSGGAPAGGPDATHPLIWPLSGLVSQGFAENPNNGYNGAAGHTGIDVVGPYGSPIYTAADGVVTFAGTEMAGSLVIGYGHFVAVAHAVDVVTLYGHMDHFVVRPGDFVHQGQLIGFEGSSGASTGPHCHFELRIKGVAVDPRVLMPAPDAGLHVGPPATLLQQLASSPGSQPLVAGIPPAAPTLPSLPLLPTGPDGGSGGK